MEFAIDGKYLKLLEIVEKELSGDSSHTVDHIQRVWRTAMQIAAEEKDVNLDVLKLAVLLHDIARIKEDTDKSGNSFTYGASTKSLFTGVRPLSVNLSTFRPETNPK